MWSKFRVGHYLTIGAACTAAPCTPFTRCCSAGQGRRAVLCQPHWRPERTRGATQLAGNRRGPGDLGTGRAHARAGSACSGLKAWLGGLGWALLRGAAAAGAAAGAAAAAAPARDEDEEDDELAEPALDDFQPLARAPAPAPPGAGGAPRAPAAGGAPRGGGAAPAAGCGRARAWLRLARDAVGLLWSSSRRPGSCQQGVFCRACPTHKAAVFAARQAVHGPAPSPLLARPGTASAAPTPRQRSRASDGLRPTRLTWTAHRRRGVSGAPRARAPPRTAPRRRAAAAGTRSRTARTTSAPGRRRLAAGARVGDQRPPRWGAGARLRRRTMAALRPWRWTPLRGPRRATGRRRRRRTVRRQQRRAVMGLDPATRRGPHSRQGWPSSRLRRRRARRSARACRAAASPRSHPGWSSAGRTARRRPSLRSRWPWATTPAAASATRLSARRCCSAPSVRVQTYTLAANRVAYYGGKRRARAVYMDSMNLVQRPFHARPPSSEELQAVRGTRHLLAARCVLLTAARAACEAAL